MTDTSMPERILFVHAHPDDETITTGGTLATLIDRGAAVTVLTCTRGERGEVIPPDLATALESHEALARLRVSELTEAMSVLGVTDHRFLGDDDARWSGGAPRSYVDSGMLWGTVGGRPVAQPAENSDPASLTAADLAEVTSDVASVIIAVAPDAVVSYDERGGYGHPDHVRAHDAARRASDLYGIPFYAIVAGNAGGANAPIGTEVIVDVSPVLEQKRRALAAYRSQLTLDGDTMVMPGGQREPVTVSERYVLLSPEPVGSPPFADQHPATRFTVTVLAGIIGVAFGALLSVYNQATSPIFGQDIWVGVIASSAIVAGLLAGLRLAFATRVVPGFAAVGMIVAVGVLSLLGVGGSVIIPWNGPGIVWQIAPTVIAVVVLVWPQRRRPGPGKLMMREITTPVSSKGPQQT